MNVSYHKFKTNKHRAYKLYGDCFQSTILRPRESRMSPWLIGGGFLMSLVVLSDAAAVARSPVPEDKNLEVPPDSWFTQYLDHFNITDNREWKQVNNVT